MSRSRWTSLRPLALAGLTAILAVAAVPASAVDGDDVADATITDESGEVADTSATDGADEVPDAAATTAEADDVQTPESTAPAVEADTVDDALETLTVEGTLVNLAVEPAADEHAHDDAADLVVETVVEVDGALYAIPEDVPVEAGVTGQAVEVALAADTDLEPVDALEIATAEAPAPGTDEAPAGSSDLPAGEAEVLAVTAAGSTTAAVEVLAEAAVGSHTLTVVPVYWSGKDNQTTASLGSLAAQTAQYWSEQSAGGIKVTTSVRDWVQIPDPGGCNTPTIMNSALRATGLGTSSTNHVLVYFPKLSSCGGWAGLASIGGGTIWVNGTPMVDVFTHEFGHNLGLGHANTATCTSGGSRVPYSGLSSCRVQEYNDKADVMGYAIEGKRSGNLNTALADHLGLVDVVRPTTSAPVTVDLAPLASTSATRAIAIPVAEGTIYIDYRPATGRDDVRQTAWAGVQVHLRTMDPVYRYPTSYLLDMNAPATAEFASPAFPAGRSWSVPGSGLVVTVQSVNSTSARVSVRAGSAGLTPSAGLLDRYIERVYLDLFGRAVDPGGLVTWRNALMSGTPRVAVANAITSSAEYRSRLIRGSYETYLGRTPDPSGLKFWLSMMSQGLTIQKMEAGFLASTEYYGKAGGTNAAWVTQLYRHVLGRDPGASEVAHWVGVLARGYGRGDVALGFLLSTEHLTTVVDGYYVDLLGRHIDPAGRTTWVRAIQNGARTEAIIGGIVASEEYYGKG